jgi:hypothetical protein
VIAPPYHQLPATGNTACSVEEASYPQQHRNESPARKHTGAAGQNRRKHPKNSGRNQNHREKHKKKVCEKPRAPSSRLRAPESLHSSRHALCSGARFQAPCHSHADAKTNTHTERSIRGHSPSLSASWNTASYPFFSLSPEDTRGVSDIATKQEERGCERPCSSLSASRLVARRIHCDLLATRRGSSPLPCGVASPRAYGRPLTHPQATPSRNRAPQATHPTSLVVCTSLVGGSTPLCELWSGHFVRCVRNWGPRRFLTTTKTIQHTP